MGANSRLGAYSNKYGNIFSVTTLHVQQLFVLQSSPENSMAKIAGANYMYMRKKEDKVPLILQDPKVNTLNEL